MKLEAIILHKNLKDLMAMSVPRAVVKKLY